MQDTLVRMGTSLEITRGGPEIVAWPVPLPGANLDPLVGWMNGQGRKNHGSPSGHGLGRHFPGGTPGAGAGKNHESPSGHGPCRGAADGSLDLWGGRLQAVIDLSSRERV